MNLLDGVDQTPDEDTLRKELQLKWADKSKEEILEAKINSDLHIKTVERENGQYRKDLMSTRDELLAKAKWEDYLDRIEKAPKNEPDIKPDLSADTLRYDPIEEEKRFQAVIAKHEQQKEEVSNFKKVEAKLKERYGDNFATVLKDQQNTLGLSGDEINTLAKRSPEAFFRIMGLNEQSKDLFQAPPRSNQRNDNFSPRGAPKRDWNYYQEMKKTNPKMYLDSKITAQMEADAIALGDAFGLPS